MKARHQVSRNAIELIKRFEGYRANAARLADGRWTIGYGHTLTAREGASVSVDDAEALLLYDLIAVAHGVNEHSYTPLNQNQFDALASFAFNIGVENFSRSAVLRRINEGSLLQAACAMEMWRKADFAGERIVIDALVRRRSAEKTLFLTPPEGWVAAPSPILPPKVDYDAFYAVPRQTPTAVTSSLDGDRAEARLDVTPSPLPVPPDEDAEPTASELAAEAVAARLQSLLPEEAVEPEAPPPISEVEPEPPVEAEPEPASETQAPPSAADWPSTVVTPTADEQAQLDAQAEAPPEPEPVEPAAESPPEPPPEPPEDDDTIGVEGDTLFDAPPPAPDALRAQDSADERGVIASFDPGFPPLRAEPGSTKAAPLLGLAMGSLVLFAGGVFGGLNSASDTSGAFFSAKTVSWMLCIVGAAGFVAAAYLLLRLLDLNDGDNDQD